MQDIEQKIASFREYCALHRCKVTSERLAILRRVYGMEDHFDADDLLIQLRKEGNHVSRATIYRTLDLLVRMGILSRERMGGDQYIYECIQERGTHYHTICTGCGKIEEFVHPDIEKTVRRVMASAGFQPVNHSLKIFGLCSECSDE